MSDRKSLIPLEHIKTSFARHLELENNSRLILSGRFGVGKTTFIREFFRGNTLYHNVHIYPVNYSVASTKDIFELIKYDVLYELIGFQPDVEPVDVTWFDTLTFLESKDIERILSSFVAAIPQVGKNILSVIEGLKAIHEAITAKQQNLKENEIHKIIRFVGEMENSKGTIYENDFYTQLIKSRVSKIQKTGRKVILTIDDLDRIDPEHVFRILNIFAAHFDNERDENKFGINGVILCCDLNNIKSIFSHRFGTSADFNGYIRKYYSRSVFHFYNNDRTREIAATLFHTTAFDHRGPSNRIFFQLPWLHANLLKIIEALIEKDLITPKELFKFHSSLFVFTTSMIDFGKQRIENWHFPITILFEHLLDLYGDVQAFKENIDKLASADVTFASDEDEELFLGSVLLVLHLGTNLSVQPNETTNVIVKIPDSAFEVAVTVAHVLIRTENGEQWPYLGKFSFNLKHNADRPDGIHYVRQNKLDLFRKAARLYLLLRSPY